MLILRTLRVILQVTEEKSVYLLMFILFYFSDVHSRYEQHQQH